MYLLKENVCLEVNNIDDLQSFFFQFFAIYYNLNNNIGRKLIVVLLLWGKLVDDIEHGEARKVFKSTNLFC